MAVNKQEFRLALAQFAASVTVVTVRMADGSLGGITVTAFSSVSLDPPLVLICIDKRARLHDKFEMGSYFAVNILSAEQEAVSALFASRSENPFAGVEYHPGLGGEPLLDGTVAQLECLVVERHLGGDHTIILGQVEAVHVVESRQPLLYCRGGYRRLDHT